MVCTCCWVQYDKAIADAAAAFMDLTEPYCGICSVWWAACRSSGLIPCVSLPKMKHGVLPSSCCW